MKTKTASLTGEALDWAVAKSVGQALLDPHNEWELCWNLLGDNSGEYYSPSTDWAQGGPIIEQEKIKLLHEASEVYSHDSKWWATTDTDYEDPRHREFGPTPLIAAMRCLVQSVFGDEIDTPKGLMHPEEQA